MELYPAVIVHGLSDAVAALEWGAAEGHGVTLLSAPGAALYAGCGWWLALVEAARDTNPGVPCIDILDCADGTGQALAALRIGLPRLVLWPDAPGRDSVAAIAEAAGGFVLTSAPPANPAVTNSRVKPAADRAKHPAGSAKPPEGPTKPPRGPTKSGAVRGDTGPDTKR
jgi:hypothetical protein